MTTAIEIISERFEFYAPQTFTAERRALAIECNIPSISISMCTGIFDEVTRSKFVGTKSKFKYGFWMKSARTGIRIPFFYQSNSWHDEVTGKEKIPKPAPNSEEGFWRFQTAEQIQTTLPGPYLDCEMYYEVLLFDK